MAYLSHQQFAEFNRLLACAIERNLPLERALDLVTPQLQTPPLRRASESVAKALQEGHSLPEALGRFPHLFPPDYKALVEAGLKGNRLAEMLRHAQSYHSLRARLARGFGKLLGYVVIALLLCFFVLILLSVVGREFKTLYADVGVELPALTTTVLWISENAWMVALALLLGFLLSSVGYALTRLLFARTRIGYLVPAWGRLQKSRDLGLFCTSMALGLDAGATLPDCLESARKALRNRYASNKVKRVRARVEEGEDLPTALFYEGFFPRTLQWATSLAHERSELPRTFHLFASLYSAEMERDFEILFMLLTPVGIVVLGNVVFFVVLLGLFLPLSRLLGGMTA